MKVTAATDKEKANTLRNYFASVFTVEGNDDVSISLPPKVINILAQT